MGLSGRDSIMEAVMGLGIFNYKISEVQSKDTVYTSDAGGLRSGLKGIIFITGKPFARAAQDQRT
jgi:hypothetical protein